MACTPLLLRLSLLSPHPLKPHSPNRLGSTHFLLPHTIAAAKSPPRRTAKTTTCLSSSSYNNTTPATDRLVSAVAYVLPLLKGLSYGRFLFAEHPGLAAAVEPVLPFLNLYHSVPYAGLVSFFALYLGLARNPRLSRYVRFNAMQAVVLNVVLSLPSLFLLILSPGRTGLGYKLMVMAYNALFIFVVCCFVYSVVCCILGRTPYLPFVAEAADRQV